MKRTASLSRRLALATTALAAAEPVPAFAQVEDIVVTAQRRSENMQDVPVAITAFGAEDISAARIEEFQDIVNRIPSLSINSYSKGSAFPALRGAAVSQPSISGGQSVGLMVDDVAYTTSADWDLSLYDIERIEVLRGPQGTLFGRNVVGGLINVVTKMPTDTFSGDAEVTLGSYGRFETKAAVNLPLGEGWTSKLSFFTQRHRGMALNRVTGNRLDANDKYGLRSVVRYQGGDLDLVFSGEYQRDLSGGTSRDYVGPSSDLPGFGFEPDDDPRVVDQRIDGDFRMRGWSLSAKGTYVAPFADVVSVTAYRERDQFLSTDILGLPRSPVTFDNDVGIKQFSQEFRVVSNGSGPLKWTAGLFYMDLKLDELNKDYFDLIPGTFLGDLQGCYRTGSASSDRCAEIFGLPPGDGSIPPNPAFVNDPKVDSLMSSRLQSYSAYAEAAYTLAHAFSLTIGARYTHERVKGSAGQFGDPNFTLEEGSYSIDFAKSFNAFTPKVSLDYQIAPQHMIYATVSKGFKGGAFVHRGSAELTAIPVDPETAWNYEVGAKTEWFDRRLRINLTAFKVDYTNQQTFLLSDEGEVIVDNAGKVKVKGIELDVEASPVKGFSLWTSYAYSDGVIRELLDLDGSKPAQLPPHAVTYGASITVPVPALSGEISLRGEGVYKSRYYLEASNEPQYSTKYDHVIDASLNYRSDDGRIGLSLWGRNLTNKTVVVYGQHAGTLFYLSGTEPGANLASSPRYNEPRTYGASLRVSF